MTSGVARPRASHCAELMRRAISTDEPVTRFPELSADLARAIGPAIGGLLGGARQRAACSVEERIAPSALLERIGPFAANCLIAVGEAGVQMLASIPIRDLLALTDRAFGGSGEMADSLPEELPLTADLVAGQVEKALCDALTSALQPAGRAQVASRASDAARLHIFKDAAECVAFTLTISEPGQDDWRVTLAARPESFAALFCAKAKPAAPARSPVADPLSGPFGDLPIELEAVMAEFSIPLARLSALSPGDTIPIALPREIPLRISETIIAYGSVCAMDERVALQITRAF